jgi:hypothetical protein
VICVFFDLAILDFKFPIATDTEKVPYIDTRGLCDGHDSVYCRCRFQS